MMKNHTLLNHVELCWYMQIVWRLEVFEGWVVAIVVVPLLKNWVLVLVQMSSCLIFYYFAMWFANNGTRAAARNRLYDYDYGVCQLCNCDILVVHRVLFCIHPASLFTFRFVITILTVYRVACGVWCDGRTSMLKNS